MDRRDQRASNLTILENKEFDLLIIGGGIYGACIAWDAAQRGLEAALVERDDFGGATSANSLKTIHGGLRYLQDGNVRRIRTMIRERKTWMRIAPHLVHPLSCLMPTTSHELTRRKLVLGVALALNDLLGFDRNQEMDPQKHLPAGRIISALEFDESVPEMGKGTITGGAIWYDAQAHNTERLLLSILLSAAQRGATVANHVEVTGFLLDKASITGVTVHDRIANREFGIRAKLVVNSTGGWTDSVLAQLEARTTSPKFHRSVAINLVTKPIVQGNFALAVPSRYTSYDQDGRPVQKSRILFAVPWHRYSLIGTLHVHHTGPTVDHPVNEDIVRAFIDEINEAIPATRLSRQDVYQVHAGYLPAIERSQSSTEVKLLREGCIYDHEQEDGISGLITVIGVKYTTARMLAEASVDLALNKLGRAKVNCRTHLTPIHGGAIDDFDEFLAQAIASAQQNLPSDTIRHLVYTYGSHYRQIISYVDEAPELGRPLCEDSAVIGAEVVHAVRHEMAPKLADVVFRRTELGMAGLPSSSCLQTCAQLMATELGWCADQVREEIDTLMHTSLSTGKRIAMM